MAFSAVEPFPSAYGTIIRETEANLAKCTQLHDTHALAQLHRKFWRRGMQGRPENKSVNVNEDKDEGDEIGPGCYILDLGIPDLRRSKLWIHKEYIRLYEYCNKYLESRRNEQVAPSVVITGQPGIDEMYNQYGPTPRICLDFVKDEAMFIVYKACHETALYKLWLETLGCMASQRRDSITDASDTLLLMKRVPRKDLIRADLNVSNGMEFIYESSEPITHAIKVELWNRLQEETRAARVAPYKCLENVEGMRQIAGLVLESLA
ncbi:hypothetical protein EDB87DRAFT_1687260 [Lactarius vividus]|nr:hypothetical protein EDB87DRAFT_1694994 [Lactarius vividus]KAH9056597.1 hypothetical protein EDB87DRAFT_1687260 [Lactarius vividus]